LTVAFGICATAGVPSASAQSIWDDPAFALYRQATEAMEQKDYARAGDLAGQAIAQYANHPLAYYLRGQAAAAQSKWDEAATAFAKAALLYPGSFASQRDLGASLERLGKIKEATRAYEAALAIKDQDALRTRLAFMLADNGEEPRAISELQTLTSRGSATPEVWATLGRLVYETGDWAGAEKAYAKSVSLRDDGRNWFNLGVIRLRLKDVSGAQQAFEKAAQHPDVRTQAEVELGRIREAAGRDTGRSRQLQTPGQYSTPTTR
jgi:tetratricopeptide (TPR) repeat protein